LDVLLLVAAANRSQTFVVDVVASIKRSEDAVEDMGEVEDEDGEEEAEEARETFFFSKDGLVLGSSLRYLSIS
jgi:hypothetical protein